MKRIVFVIESLSCGGAEKSLITLLQNLDYKKYNVDLLLLFDKGDFYKFVPHEVNITFLDLISNLPFYEDLYKRILFYCRKKFNLKEKYHPSQLFWKTYKNNTYVFQKNYDVAIAYNQGFATYFVANNISSKKKYSWLNTDYKKAGYNIYFDYKFYKKFNHVICVSKENENSFLNELNKLNEKIETSVIKDITDDILIKKMSLEGNGFEEQKDIIKLLTVGRLAVAKNYNLAIEACKILTEKRKNIKWFVVGEGVKRKELEMLIEKYNLNDNFQLLGLKENPYPYIRTCDLYVQTSLFEGLPLTLREAAILTKPIVTTNFPSAYKIIDNNNTGLICEMTAQEVANAIEKYIEDSDLKQKVVSNLSLLTNNDKEVTLKKINDLFDA